MRERYAWMAENMGKWPSGHGQLTKIRLPDGCGREPFQRRCNLGMIVMDLKALWEMSVYIMMPQGSRFTAYGKESADVGES